VVLWVGAGALAFQRLKKDDWLDTAQDTGKRVYWKQGGTTAKRKTTGGLLAVGSLGYLIALHFPVMARGRYANYFSESNQR